jgi:hypothetical protein
MTTFSPLAFIELGVVTAFAAAWLVVELVCRRLDRQRETKTDDEKDRSAGPKADVSGER